MAWRVARSLDVLLAQINASAPRRNKAADGSIGDAAHQDQGSYSDHNPWYGPGIVTARDFTHDPANGLDCHQLAAALAASRDPRIKYMIWQGRIMDSRPQFSPWQWKPSSGHYHHLHLSVMPNASADDTRPWALAAPTNPSEDDMQPDERKALMDIRGYLYAGGPDVDKGVGHRNSVFGVATDTNKALAAVYELTGKNIGQVLAEQAAQIADLSAKVDRLVTGTGHSLQEIAQATAAATVAELKKEGN